MTGTWVKCSTHTQVGLRSSRAGVNIQARADSKIDTFTPENKILKSELFHSLNYNFYQNYLDTVLMIDYSLYNIICLQLVIYKDVLLLFCHI